MSEPYTPTTDDVRDALSEWMWNSRTWRPGLIGADTNGAFDRFLAQVRREAKIEALMEFAKGLDLDAIADEWSTTDYEYWAAGNAASEIQSAAFDLADQLEQEGKNDE